MVASCVALLRGPRPTCLRAPSVQPSACTWSVLWCMGYIGATASTGRALAAVSFVPAFLEAFRNVVPKWGLVTLR